MQTSGRLRRFTLVVCLAFLASRCARALDPEAPAAAVTTIPAPAQAPCKGPHIDIEDLNMLGADAGFPPYADTVTGASNPLRRAMLCHDYTYRVVEIAGVTANTLATPVASAQQAYVGQRPTLSSGNSFAIVADLASIHLPGYQITFTGFLARANWQRAFPNAFKMAQIMAYKPFFHRRLEFKGGYQDNDSEFIGMQVGGSMASGAQGVYAVLPYEIGMSYMPLAAPTFTARAQPRGNFYAKLGLQRSVSPSGEGADLARDAAGFRFDPKGEGLLKIFEGGYNRPASAGTPQFWVRGGYLSNSTSYANAKTGTSTAGNSGGFLLADRQLHRSDEANPARGLYLGGSLMTAAPEVNAYSRYYEVRLYQNAPFRRRPSDMVSVVSSYTAYSKYFTGPLLAAGKTAATHAVTLSSAYSLRVHAGTYLSTVLSYDSRPAISPRLGGALTITSQASIFF